MQKADLMQVLKTVAPALHTRDFIPILTHICLASDHVYAFDDKSAVVFYTDLCDGIEGAVRGKTLIDAVDNSGNELTLSVEDGSLVITDSDTELKLPMMSADAFLFQMPDFDNPAASFAHSTKEGTMAFFTMLDLLAGNANDESMRPELLGVTLRVDDAGVTLYSTDNVSLGTASCQMDQGEGEGTVILAKSSCQLIAKIFKDFPDSEVTFYILDGSLLVDYSGDVSIQVVCKTIEATPSDYDSIVRANVGETDWSVIPSNLPQVLARASGMFKDDYDRVVLLSPSKNGIVAYCKGAYGEMRSELTDCEQELPEDVSVNPSLVSRMLQNADAITFCANALALYRETDYHTLTYLVSYKRSK